MLIVQKYGGTSVADPACIHRAAARSAQLYREGARVVTVVSAQGDTTDLLLKKAMEISPEACGVPDLQDQAAQVGEVLTGGRVGEPEEHAGAFAGEAPGGMGLLFCRQPEDQGSGLFQIGVHDHQLPGHLPEGAQRSLRGGGRVDTGEGCSFHSVTSFSLIYISQIQGRSGKGGPDFQQMPSLQEKIPHI